MGAVEPDLGNLAGLQRAVPVQPDRVDGRPARGVGRPSPGGVNAWPVGKVKRSVQVNGADPVLVRVRPALKPFEPDPHGLIE